MDVNLWLRFATFLACSNIIYQVWILAYQLINKFRQDINQILILRLLLVQLLEELLVFIPDLI